MSPLILLALLGTHPGAQPQDESAAAISHCKVEYVHTSKLGMPMMGVIGALHVQPGDHVTAGQVLASLPVDEEMANMAMAKFTAENDVPVRLAVVRYDLAKTRAVTAQHLYERRAYSVEQWRTDSLAAAAAKLEVERAERDHSAAQLNYNIAKAKLALRQIRAPHDGIVSEVFKHPGEGGLMGDTCIQVDDPSLLRISARVDVRDSFRIKIGDSARVRFETMITAIDNEARMGIVRFVDTKIDPTRQTRLVIVEVSNEHRAPLAGTEASVQFVSELAAR